MSDCCLVYEALERTEIFCAPTTESGYETGKFFTRGDMVSVDQVKDPFSLIDGEPKSVFLRLSDGTGWVPLSATSSGGDKGKKKEFFKPVHVEQGVWCFFVDNFPDGIKAHNHPIDELQHQWQNLMLETVPKIGLKPMAMIYCDRKVKGRNDVNFYRLQHGLRHTPAWIFDKRRRLDSNEKHHPVLLPETSVQQGIFAFRALQQLKLRIYPLANKRNMTGASILPNDIFVVDIIRGEKGYNRLIDGSGWVFVGGNAPQAEQVPVEAGKFVFRVTTPYGIKLQTQPDDERSSYGDVIKQNEIVVCDCKLVPDSLSAYGRTFYHVKNTCGWVSDMSNDRQVMEKVDNAAKITQLVNGDGWTSGFVRGVSVATMSGVEEISCNEESQLITFTHPSGAKLNVFYATKTVGITRGSGGAQSFCRNCTNNELVEIFKDPEGNIRDDPAVDESMEDDDVELSPEELKQQEVEARQQLMNLDGDYQEFLSKKEQVWKAVAKHQDRREIAELQHQERWMEHMKQHIADEERRKREEDDNQRAKEGRIISADDRCYVYRVIHDIGVRTAPNVGEEYRTDRAFSSGDLVSIDSILDFVSHNQCGPYLRLSDGSGWLFARDSQGVVMQEVPVQAGLWTFYVGNEPTGVGLRKHPMDKAQDGSKGYIFDEDTSLNFLKPFEKVICDRRVVGSHGVNFYRVKGQPKTAWIFDRRYSKDNSVEMVLHPANQVREGLFAFEAMDDIAIRRQASISRKYKTKKGVSSNDIVVANLIFEPGGDKGNNGPFLRLADGSGWLFIKIDGDRVMKDAAIKSGRWKFRICHPDGLKLRKQPSDLVGNNALDLTFKQNQVVVCDREITCTSGLAYYYRPQGLDGWLPNFRGKFRLMEEVPDDVPVDDVGFTVDFVRGLAMGLDGMKEVEYNENGQALTFLDAKGRTIIVYCGTQTICTPKEEAEGVSDLRKGISKEELVDFFKQSGSDDVSGRPSKRRRRTSTSDPVVKVEENAEEDYRARLLELEKEEEEIKRQREEIWKSVRDHEKKQEDEESSSVAKPASTANSDELLECPVCHRTFTSLYSKQMHLNSTGHG